MARCKHCDAEIATVSQYNCTCGKPWQDTCTLSTCKCRKTKSLICGLTKENASQYKCNGCSTVFQ